MRGLYPVEIYKLKGNNNSSKKKYKICSELKIKTPEKNQLWTDFALCSGVSVVYLEQVNAHLVKCSFVLDFFMAL